MSIFRVQKNHENPYVMLDKFSVNDSGLSWKAKGLLAYLLSKPDDWQVYERDVIAHARDSRDSVRAGLKELEAAGYIQRAQARNESGRFAEKEYRVFERPLVGHSLVGGDSPATENPSTVKTRAKPRKKPRYPKIKREITSRADDGCATMPYEALPKDIEFMEAVKADSRRRRGREVGEL